MALKTVADLKYSVAGILQGTNLNNVTNLNGALERTARTLLQLVDIPEAGNSQAITLYSGVYDYALNASIYGAYVNDFRPQGLSRGVNDYVYRQGPELFDRTKKFLPNGYQLTFEFINGAPFIRVASPKPTERIVLDSVSLTTGWAVGGSASALAVDNNVFYDDPASLKFTLTGASSGYIEKTISTVDLTDYLSVGVIFIPVYTPSATNLSSVEIRLGTSSSAYYSLSKTSGFLGAFVANDWTLMAFDLSLASTTGSPTITSIKYARITVAHAATLTNFRVGGLWISLPSPHELIYQSAAIFLPSASSTASQTITTDSDVIILSDSAYVLYEYESALTIAQQAGGGLSTALIQQINQKLHGVRARNGAIIQAGLYDIYSADNPSQNIRLSGSYYE